MLIYLVRHGETDYNRDNIFQGTLETELNERGRNQVTGLAQSLSHIHFHAVYSSPLKRAMETTSVIVEHNESVKNLEIQTVHNFRELDYGDWQGISQKERQSRYADMDLLWRRDPWSTKIPNGETLEKLYERVSKAIDSIINFHTLLSPVHPATISTADKKEDDKSILISAHGHVNRMILIHLLGLNKSEFTTLELNNGTCKIINTSGTLISK